MKLQNSIIKIENKEIIIGALIGEGAFSNIYATQFPEYVVKVVNLGHEKTLKSYQIEEMVLKRLKQSQSSGKNNQHELQHLLIYKGVMRRVINSQQVAFILLENCPYGSLLQFLAKYDQKQMSEQMIFEIIYQIASGINALHRMEIIHRDIKLENVLIGLDGQLKIIDYGSALLSLQPIRVGSDNRQAIEDDIELNTTPNYRAPEQCDLYSQQDITEKVDMWAIGVLLFALMYQKPAFESKLAIINKRYFKSDDLMYSQEMHQILDQLLQIDQNERWSSQQLLAYLENNYKSKGSQHQQINFCQISQNSPIILNQSLNRIQDQMPIKGPNPKQNEKKITPKFLNICEKYYARLTKKTEAWFLSAIEMNSDRPKQKYVRQLILKAWFKRSKISKFYGLFTKRLSSSSSTQHNTVIVLKCLIVLHQYVRQGPPEALNILSFEASNVHVFQVLEMLGSQWREIASKHIIQNSDKHRNVYLSSLISAYAQLLIEKFKLGIKYKLICLANYSLNPYFLSVEQQATIVPLQIVSELISFLNNCEGLCSNELFQADSLWKIQSSVAFTIIQDATSLIQTLIIMFYALKRAFAFTSLPACKFKLKEFINKNYANFKLVFNKFDVFINKVRSLNEAKQELDVIPVLPNKILDYLEGMSLEENTLEADRHYNLVDFLNPKAKVMNVELPISYGPPILELKNQSILEQVQMHADFDWSMILCSSSNCSCKQQTPLKNKPTPIQQQVTNNNQQIIQQQARNMKQSDIMLNSYVQQQAQAGFEYVQRIEAESKVNNEDEANQMESDSVSGQQSEFYTDSPSMSPNGYVSKEGKWEIDSKFLSSLPQIKDNQKKISEQIVQIQKEQQQNQNYIEGNQKNMQFQQQQQQKQLQLQRQQGYNQDDLQKLFENNTFVEHMNEKQNNDLFQQFQDVQLIDSASNKQNQQNNENLIENNVEESQKIKNVQESLFESYQQKYNKWQERQELQNQQQAKQQNDIMRKTETIAVDFLDLEEELTKIQQQEERQKQQFEEMNNQKMQKNQDKQALIQKKVEDLFNAEEDQDQNQQSLSKNIQKPMKATSNKLESLFINNFPSKSNSGNSLKQFNSVNFPSIHNSEGIVKSNLSNHKYQLEQQQQFIGQLEQGQAGIDAKHERNFLSLSICQSICIPTNEFQKENVRNQHYNINAAIGQKKRSKQEHHQIHQKEKNLQNQNIKLSEFQRQKQSIDKFIKSEYQKSVEDLFLNDAELSYGEVIGQGSSSLVCKGEFRGAEVAIKMLKSMHLLNNETELKRELSVLIKIRPNPYLVQFIGISEHLGQLCLVTEYLAGGSLFQLLHRSQIVLSWKQRIQFMLDVALGMVCLHSAKPPILHRDLKSLNILLDGKIGSTQDKLVRAKIADFGLARIQDVNMTGLSGTFHWMAPEIYQAKQYTTAADVYSFGIVIWEICNRVTPYEGFANPQAIMHHVVVENGRPNMNNWPYDCPLEIQQLMKQCWDQNPLKRPTFKQIQQKLKECMKQFLNK